MNLKRALFFLVSLALVIHGAFGITRATLAESPNVCPPGNVKYEVPQGYEYNDGSGWIDADEWTVSWGPNPGYTVTGVCIMIGGPGGGDLIWPDPDLGFWENPTQYGVSHVVLYTDQLPTDTPTPPVDTPTPTEPVDTPTPPADTPTPTEPVETPPVGDTPTPTEPVDTPEPTEPVPPTETPTEPVPPEEPTETPAPVETPVPPTGVTVPYLPFAGAVMVGLGLTGMLLSLAIGRRK